MWQSLTLVARRSDSLVSLAVLVLSGGAALITAGCGSQVKSAAIPSAVADKALAGSPPALAALHRQANQLLGGGTPAFTGRRLDLRGYPVVVNKWASWCGPCQSEFPIFQRVSVAYGRRVAFVGVDANDHTSAARAFLHTFPVTYPSYSDPHQTISSSIKANTYFPQTVFINRGGRVVFQHAGPYLNAKALEQDIQHYALGAAS